MQIPKAMKIVASLFFVTLSLLPVRADWLMFRGSYGNGSTHLSLPVTIKTQGDKSWVRDLPGRGIASPVVVGDTIYLSASSGPFQEDLHVLAYDSSDGKQLWQRTLKATGRTVCHKKTCVAASTLASDGKGLVAQFSSNDIFAFDLKGNLLWARGLTFDHPNIANGLGMSSSPVVVQGVAVIQVENDADSYAFGLDLENGTTLWQKKRPKAANWTSPVIINTKARSLVGLQSKEGMTAIEPTTGKTVWDYQDGASTIPSSAWTEKSILLLPSHGITALQVAHDLQSFESIWVDNKLKPGTGSPSSKDGFLYVVNNANVLSCASVETGEIQWRLRLKGPVSGSPLITADHLYVFSEDGLGQVVNIKAEKPEVVHTLNLGDTILCTPAVAKDAILVRSDSKLWKLSE
jgi:outer membrane protein assembly factor BamB